MCQIVVGFVLCAVLADLQVSAGIGDEEDALHAEKEAEQARLKELGLERARRAEEDRIKRCVQCVLWAEDVLCCVCMRYVFPRM